METTNNMIITYRNGYQAIVVTYSEDLEGCGVDTIGINTEEIDCLIDAALAAQGADFGGFTSSIS